MLAQSFFQFTVIFGIGYGFCNGIAYTIPLKLCWDLYPERKGMVSGVIICGFGVGSFIFSFISTMLVNPLNIKTRVNYIENTGDKSIRLYGDEVALNVPDMMIYMVLSWIVICCFGILLLKGESGNQKKVEEQLLIKDEVVSEQESENDDLTLNEILHDQKFYHLYIMNFSSVFYGYILISSFKVFAGQFIKDDFFLTQVGSCACIFGSLRFFWSMMLDYKFSYSQVYGTLIVLQMICSLMIYDAAKTKNNALFLAIVCLSMFCEGGHFVLLPSHCADVYKSSKKGVQVFSYLFSCFGLSSILGSLISGFLVERYENGYQIVFGIATLLNLVSFMVLMRYDIVIKEHESKEYNNSMVVNIQNDIEITNAESFIKPMLNKANLNNASNNDAASTNLDTSFNQSTISSI